MRKKTVEGRKVGRCEILLPFRAQKQAVVEQVVVGSRSLNREAANANTYKAVA